ncbi:MAG: BON domain-containing protein [Thermoguttaceae bacterium]|nr:BON domain-containing protein [Thermoguttaceae bacterium]
MTAVCVPLAFGGNQEEANRIAKTISAAFPQYTVEVAYKNGRVRLRGEVESAMDRQRIAQMVSQFPGVQSVSADSIQIAPEVSEGFSYGTNQPAFASQVLPAVPAAENQAVPEFVRAEQIPAQQPGQMMPAASPLPQSYGNSSASYNYNNSPIMPVAGEFSMNSSLETAPLQNMPLSTESTFQAGPVQGNVQLGSGYAPAPAAAGNAYSAPAANPTLYAQNSYAPAAAPQGIPVAAGRNGQNGEPNLPNYAWPTTADYPNYSQVGYPKQYAASAFPYIGPFYPYPQVPLGWRKVTMEWHDGYWWLDFNDGSVNGPFSPLFRQPTKYR